MSDQPNNIEPITAIPLEEDNHPARPDLSAEAQEQLKVLVEGNILVASTAAGENTIYAIRRADESLSDPAVSQMSAAVFQEWLQGGHIAPVNSETAQGENVVYDLV